MSEIKKLTYKELYDVIKQHNDEHNITCQYEDENPLFCVIVFKNESWPNRKQDYSLESRSYKFRSDEKFFLPYMGGNSIFAETLDGSDACKLNNYLGEWIIDYCYVMQEYRHGQC